VETGWALPTRMPTAMPATGAGPEALPCGDGRRLSSNNAASGRGLAERASKIRQLTDVSHCKLHKHLL
jgi:hypothetical protein